MDWIWALYEKYIRKQFSNAGEHAPSDAELERAFLQALRESSITVLVQEPHLNSVRFKGLERAPVLALTELVHDPMGYLLDRYGGGKFKLNFHRGWHFVATQNFKPEGEPRWKDLPEIDY